MLYLPSPKDSYIDHYRWLVKRHDGTLTDPTSQFERLEVERNSWRALLRATKAQNHKDWQQVPPSPDVLRPNPQKGRTVIDAEYAVAQDAAGGRKAAPQDQVVRQNAVTKAANKIIIKMQGDLSSTHSRVVTAIVLFVVLFVLVLLIGNVIIRTPNGSVSTTRWQLMGKAINGKVTMT